ncbi:MAG: heparinase II/III family protein [Clostridia bacterium]|nr:heparinase II/III family protein [Clostridia bacterium]
MCRRKLSIFLCLCIFTAILPIYSHKVSAENEYLLYDDFEYELADNTAPVAYTSDFSKNRLLEVDGTITTTSVKMAEEKGSNAFFISTQGFMGTSRTESCIDYRYLPNVAEGDVTCEFCICAPVSESGKGAARFTLPVNNQIPVLALFDNQKKIYINEKYYAPWEAGKWYSIAVTVHIDTDVCDIYLNGVCVDKGVALASAPGGIDVVGGRVKVASLMMPVSDGTSADSVVGYDDIRIYKGDYKSKTYNFKQTNLCTPLNSYKQIYLGGDATVDEFCTDMQYQSTVYTDNSFCEKASENVSDGQYAVMAYPDGVCTYEIIKPVAFDGMGASGYHTLTAMEISDCFLQPAHPRIMLNSDKINRIKSLKETDRVVKKLSSKIIRYADKYLSAGRIVYSEDADAALSNARTLRDHVFYLGMAYLLTGDEEYPQHLWTDLSDAGNFSDWGHSAKFLATSEAMAAFGVAYDWLYDYWSDEQREFLRNSIMNLGLYQSLRAYCGRMTGISSSSTWPYNDGNWNAVCNGGTLIGATAIYETTPDLCSVAVSNAVKGIGYMMNSFAPDGAWHEGIGYWSYMMRYLVPALQVLDMNYNYDFGFDRAVGFDNTIEFMRAVNGSCGINNFHDVDYSVGDMSCDYLYWFADKLNSIEYFDERTEGIDISGAGSIYDLVFYNPDKEYRPTARIKELDAYFGNVEYVSMRSAYADDALYLSYHTDKTVCSHTHADDGTFVLDMLGERWAMDLGTDSYSLPRYFSNKRYDYYRTRAEGHNTLVINPDSGAGQMLGVDTQAQKPVDTGAVVYSIADLTNAYSNDATSLKRGFMLTDNRSNVVIRDEISLKKLSDVYWFMHTDAQIQLKDNNTAVLTKNGKSVTAKLVSNAKTAKFSVMDAKPLPTSPESSEQNANEGIRKLTVTAKESGNVYFQISVSADDSFSFSDTALSQWDNIRADVLLSENFDDGIFTGTVLRGSALTAQARYGKASQALTLARNTSVKYTLGENTYSKQTVEFSAQAFSGSKVKNADGVLVEFNEDGKIKLLGQAVGEWTENYWYHFAIEMSDNSSSLYINGEYVADSQDVTLSELCFESGEDKSCKLDDIKVYSGGYSPKIAELSFANNYYINDNVIFIPCEMESNKLVKSASANMDISIYSNLRNEAEASYVTEDTVLVLRDDDLGIVKYYGLSTDVEHDDILYCDMELAKNLANNKALSKNMYVGNISSTEIKNIDSKTTLTSVKNAGNGKSGVAYYFDKKNCTDTDEITFDFKFIPTVTEGSVTFEISVKAPSGTYDNKDNFTVYLPYNSTYKRMVVFDDSGYIMFNNQRIEKYKPGRWYNFAVSFDVGTKYADFYINGLWLGKNTLWSYQNSDKIDAVGGRMRVSSKITGLGTGATYTGSVAFDDVKVYSGKYYPELYTPVLVVDGIVSDSINMDASCSETTFLDKLNSSKGEINIFKDGSFAVPKLNYVSDGQLLSIASDSIVRYFDVNVQNGISLNENTLMAASFGDNNIYLVKRGKSGALDAVKIYNFTNNISITADDSYSEILLWHNNELVPICEKMIIPDNYWSQ